MNHRLLAFLFALLAVSVPSAFICDEKAEQEAVNTFKRYVTDLMARYKAEKHERIERHPRCDIEGVPHGYLKATYEPDLAYTFDVRKTDSLVSPYVGILELRWKERHSDCEETRDKAQSHSDLPYSNDLRYRYTYVFRDGKWVPHGREIGSMTAEGNEFRWESCEDERAHLEAGGYDADFGCVVPN